MSRRFSKKQRVDLFLAAAGRCTLCGDRLKASWHADHRTPWSKGGETAIENGDALCPDCNLRKSNNMIQSFQTPGKLELRKWQAEFLNTFFAKILSSNDGKNFLLVATPGAGKTVAQLMVAYNLKELDLIDWIVICVPSDHLRNQMGRDASQKFGLELYHDTGFVDVHEYAGEIVTYAQVAANPGVWQHRCSIKRTFLSSDEVHHLADELSWGETYQQAFNNASYRLSTSGTPFRSDNKPIPWVSYKDLGNGTAVSQPDYSYAYGKGLAEGVCRHVVFPSYDSTCTWLFGNNEFVASFKDQLNKQLASQRRNTVINIDGEWLTTVLRDANERLSLIRSDGHANAAGLIVCRDKTHAESIATKVKDITGESPCLVTSDVAQASDKIETFACQTGLAAPRWIVAVKMVSEGVDIKRLRVAVYATNVMTEMYFRQFVGRVIRMIGEYTDETAYVYVYPDNPLVEFIEQIKEERDHIIQLINPSDPLNGNSNLDEKSDEQADVSGTFISSYIPIEATAEASDHFWDQKRYSFEDIQKVRHIAQKEGIPEVKVIEILKMAQKIDLRLEENSNSKPDAADSVPHVSQGQEGRVSKTDRKKQARLKVNNLTLKLASIIGKEPRQIHKFWQEELGGEIHEKATEKDLEKKLFWVKECLKSKKLVRMR